MNEELKELDSLAEEFERDLSEHRSEVDAAPGERGCPSCGETMKVENYHGIHVDVCKAHGVWFDKGELPTLIETVRSRAVGSTKRIERKKRMNAIREAKREGKQAGAMYGWLSLLFD